MNWVIWTIGGILLTGFIIGLYRGAVRIAVSIVTAILTIAITFFVTPYVAEVVEEKTPLDESIQSSTATAMDRATKAILGIEDEEVEGEEDTEIPRDIQIQAIEESELPEVFKELLTENNNAEIYSELGVESFAQYVGTYLSRLMIHVMSFLALLLIVTIILRAIVFALNIVNDIPVFGLLNRLAGGVLGLGFSIVIIWFFFVVVTLIYTTDIGKQIYDTIQEHEYIRMLYENNPLLKMSIKF